MKIVALIKDAIDVSQLKTREEVPIIEETPRKMSDLDRNALEEAVRIKEKFGDKEVKIKVINVTDDPEKARQIVLEALAMGADEAVSIKGKRDHLFDSKAIADEIRKEEFDLIICGDSSVDSYSSQMGPRVAEELGVPVVTYVNKLEVLDGKIKAERSLEDYYEIVEVEFPALVTVTREINEPRFPAVLQIMRASRKPYSVKEAEEGEIGLEILDLKAPEMKRKNLLIKKENLEEAVKELIELLRREGAI